jgi:hypothetical protein
MLVTPKVERFKGLKLIRAMRRKGTDNNSMGAAEYVFVSSGT